MRRNIALPATIFIFYAATVFLNINFHDRIIGSGPQPDIIQRMFGSLRSYVGDWAFIKAEEYHHRGLPFEHALEFHRGESMFSHEHEDGDHEGSRVKNSAAREGLYGKIYSQVKVTKDSHLKPEEEKEALPWFYVETAFNPNDIRGYVMGAYWLERIGRAEEGLKFLREGEKNNPDSARIYSAFGEYYFKRKKYDEAVKYLERSCGLWLGNKGINAAPDNYSQSDRLFAFDLLGSIYSHEKNYSKALDTYNDALKFGPNPAILEKAVKVKKIVKGGHDNN